MNSLINKLRNIRFCKKNIKKIMLSVVIILEVIAIGGIVAYAWVETVSSIKITNETNTSGTVSNTFVFTDAMIGSQNGTIDLTKYFKKSGDMHLAPASSADGKTFYFPKANMASGFNVYRKGNVSDKNTTYISVTFRVKVDTNADFFFTKTPAISVSDDIRVSITAQSEGSTAVPDTTIYSNQGGGDAKVVDNVNGTLPSSNNTNTHVEKFSDHVKGKSSSARLFAVGANETKIVTVNVWLQKDPSINTDLTTNMADSKTINNLGITSSLTPRHVTLLPTPTWDVSGTTQYFYAWCWGATNGDASRLYKLELDDKEHYSFDYNGTYQNTLFFRSGNGNLTTETMNANNNAAWSNGTIWNKTEDTSIPNDPIDPTYIIETINGSSQIDTSSGNNSTAKKSTGSWHDPAIIHVAHITDQTDTWGTLAATSYVGTTTSTQVIEATNSNSSKHKDTVHAWPEKKLTLQASANSNYAFVGWYDNAAGTGQALSANTTYEPNAPSTATEITYYAKFKETRTLTINALLDGSNSTTAVDYVKINNETITKSGTSYSKIVDKGSSVSFEAAAKSGYTLSGIYTTDNGNSTATSPLNPINSNTTYYARFTTNSYNVTANAYYSNNGGSSYTAGNSGGTVKAGSIDAGATSTASVKYKASVTLVATPQSGYVFDGWYNAASGGTKVSGDASYSYTLNTANNVNVYARFIGQTWEIGHGTSGGSNWSYNSMSVSGNTVTGTLTLTEGQDFSFKIRKTVGSAKTYYGAASSGVSYQNITSTTFISNLTLSSPGNDIYMKGHAGTYTFTFNKSTNVLNVTASYSNITITLDSSSTTWIADASAMVYCDTDGSGYLMTKNSSSNWTAQVPSNKAGTFSFKRNNPENTATWNQWNPSDSRGYRTTYKTTGDGTGSWQ